MRGRTGDIIEFQPKGTDRQANLSMAEVFLEGPSEQLAADQVFATVLHGPGFGEDWIVSRDEIKRVWRELKR